MSIPADKLDDALTRPTDMRLFVIADAMFNHGYTVDKMHDLTKIDKVMSSSLNGNRFKM